MIGKIGLKKTIILAVLVLTLAGLAAIYELSLVPKVTEARQKLDAVNAEVASLQSDVDEMRADFVLFQKEKKLYDDIERMGFFNNQDRVLARERFDTLQKLSKVISARYEIKSANVVEVGNPESVEYVVLESPISVELSALDDLDAYRFIYFLNYGFPGHITIENMSMARTEEVTAEILKRIGTGSPPQMVNAKLSVMWRTMVRKKDILPEDIIPLIPQNGGTAHE